MSKQMKKRKFLVKAYLKRKLTSLQRPSKDSSLTSTRLLSDLKLKKLMYPFIKMAV